MEQFDHRGFMESNGIREEELPAPLRNKISIFNRIAAKLQDTLDDDHERLLTRLEKLDKEITGDLEDEYEEQLENNEFLVTNEDILEELLRKGVPIIGSLDLKRLGYKGELVADIIPLKNFCLERASIFSYKYRIHKRQ